MDMTHTRVSAVPAKERKDECQMLRMSYFKAKKQGEKRKLNVGLGFHSSLCSGEHQSGVWICCNKAVSSAQLRSWLPCKHAAPLLTLLTVGASIFCQKSSGQTWQLSAPLCLFVEENGGQRRGGGQPCFGVTCSFTQKPRGMELGWPCQCRGAAQGRAARV